MTLSGVWLAVVNLRPRGRPQDPLTWTDGLWVRVAWRGIRAGAGAPAVWRDPHETTSVPPPQARPS